MSMERGRTVLRGKAISYQGLGGPEVIEVVTREVRAPEANEVRIEVKAAAVNPTDLLLRDANLQSSLVSAVDQSSLIVPGVDAAGVIESVGPGVTRLSPGDSVMTVVIPRRPEGGAQAQYIVVPAASVVRMPKGASWAEASTLPMNGLTALLALEAAALRAGQVLAVSGGAGHLARFTMAIAKQRGLRVIADAKPSEVELVRSLGADVVVERGPEFAKAVRQVFPEGVDALVDTAVLGDKVFAALRTGGTYIPVRGWNGGPAEREIAIKPILVYDAFQRTDWLELLRDLVETRVIQLIVAGEYSPEKAADAQRALAKGGLRGRPVIVF